MLAASISRLHGGYVLGAARKFGQGTNKCAEITGLTCLESFLCLLYVSTNLLSGGMDSDENVQHRIELPARNKNGKSILICDC